MILYDIKTSTRYHCINFGSHNNTTITTTTNHNDNNNDNDTNYN